MAQFQIRRGLRVFQKSDKVEGGLADGKSPKDFDPKALAQGVKVEMEHTKDQKVAREIAMDHLAEDKDYYRKLEGMEAKPKDNVEAAILKFLEKNPKPKDKQVHALAGKLGLNEHKFEERVYALLAKKTGAAEKSMDNEHGGLAGLGEYLEKAKKQANPNQMSLFGGGGKKAVVEFGKRGGRIVGRDKKGKPIYEGSAAAKKLQAKQARKPVKKTKSGAKSKPEPKYKFERRALDAWDHYKRMVQTGKASQGGLAHQAEMASELLVKYFHEIKNDQGLNAKTDNYRDLANDMARKAREHRKAWAEKPETGHENPWKDKGGGMIGPRDAATMFADRLDVEDKVNLDDMTEAEKRINGLMDREGYTSITADGDVTLTAKGKKILESIGAKEPDQGAKYKEPTGTVSERAKMKHTPTMAFDEVDKLLEDTFGKLVGPMAANLTGKERQVPAKEASKILAKAKLQARRMKPGERNKIIAQVRKFKQDAQKYAKRLQQAINKVGYGEVFKARATRDTLKRYLDAFEADKKEMAKPGNGKYTTDKPATLQAHQLEDIKRQVEQIFGPEFKSHIPKDVGEKIKATYQDVLASNQDNPDWGNIEMTAVLYKVGKMTAADIFHASDELKKEAAKQEAEAGAKKKEAEALAEKTKPRVTDEMPGGGKLGESFKVGDTLQFGRHQYKVMDLKVADKGGKTEYTVTLRNANRGTRDYEITVDTKNGWNGFGLPDSARYALYGDNGPKVLGDTIEGGVTKQNIRTGLKVNIGGQLGSGYKVAAITGNSVIVTKDTEVDDYDWQGTRTGSHTKTYKHTYRWDGRGYKRGGDYLTIEGETKKSLDAIERLAQYGQDNLEKNMEEKTMSAIDELATYGMDPEELENLKLAKSEMPTGKPTMGGAGEEQGGKLAGVGATSGSNDSAPGKGFDKDGKPTGATSPKKDKLSEDDEDDEDQMKPHKKPIETTKKSMDDLRGTIPSHQREVVAHEHAQVASKLRKGADDVVVGLGVPEPAQDAPFQLEKGRMWSQGPDSLIQYSEEADMAAERLIKSDEFYVNGSPTITPTSVLIHQRTRCPACKDTFAKSLTACPKCGYGSVHQDFRKGEVEDYDPDMAKSRKPILRPARRDEDLYLPNGVALDEE